MNNKRSLLKRNARIALKGKWSYGVSATLIYTLIIFVISLISSLFSYGSSIYSMMLSWIASVIVSLLSGLFSAGLSYTFLKISRGETPVYKDLFAVFQMNPDRFIIVDLLTELPTYLLLLPIFFFSAADYSEGNLQPLFWMLIFLILICILSVVFAILFFPAHYLLFDFPEMNAFDALKTSFRLMKGKKWNFFVLKLSFLGWSLISLLTLNLAQLWLCPYQETTWAHFYDSLPDPLQSNPTVSDC